MSWTKLDDRFAMHRKVRPLSDAAFRLHVSAILWASENLTDGVIKTDELRLVSDVVKVRRAVDELERCGLWETESGGWRIHDYLDYQPSSVQVRAGQTARRARQARWRRRSRDASTDPSRDDPEDADVDGGDDASRDGSDDASRDGLSRTRLRARSPSRPVPSRSGVTSGGERSSPERADERDDPPTPDRPKSTHDERPAAQCPRHLGRDDDPPCRSCRDARQAAEAWDSRHRLDDTLAVRRCSFCDADGWRYERGVRVPITPYVRCDHTPKQTAEEARRA